MFGHELVALTDPLTMLLYSLGVNRVYHLCEPYDVSNSNQIDIRRGCRLVQTIVPVNKNSFLVHVITPLHGSLGTVKPLWDMSWDRQTDRRTGRQSWENRRGRGGRKGGDRIIVTKPSTRLAAFVRSDRYVISPLRRRQIAKKQPLKQVRYFNIIMRWQRPEPHSIDGICRIDSDKRLIFEPEGEEEMRWETCYLLPSTIRLTLMERRK